MVAELRTHLLSRDTTVTNLIHQFTPMVINGKTRKNHVTNQQPAALTRKDARVQKRTSRAETHGSGARLQVSDGWPAQAARPVRAAAAAAAAASTPRRAPLWRRREGRPRDFPATGYRFALNVGCGRAAGAPPPTYLRKRACCERSIHVVCEAFHLQGSSAAFQKAPRTFASVPRTR